MARAPFTAKWVQAGASIFQWGRKAAYWKGKKGWWASRQDFEGIKGRDIPKWEEELEDCIAEYEDLREEAIGQ